METLIFRPEPFGSMQREAGAGGCGCSACAQREYEYEADDELDDELDDDELCPDCGLPHGDLELEGTGTSRLVDLVIDRPAKPKGGYGTPSSKKNPKTTSKRCVDGQERNCPVLSGVEDITQIDGVGFEYIGGFKDKKTKKERHGLEKVPGSTRWRVVEKNRLKPRIIQLIPRGSDALATFIGNMKAAGLAPVAVLTMGSIVCRCISNSNNLSDHSDGDAFDIGGVRFADGNEVLVANSKDPADHAILHRVNACARLAWAHVLDYYAGGGHWNHLHCDTNGGKRRVFKSGWKFVREALGLKLAGGFDKACANALRQFANNQDAVKSADALDRTLTALFKREATRT
ncbi:MAG TPA: extensin family protein [Kofleriaceae bacterium]